MSYYDYYTNYCICQSGPFPIGMFDLEGNETYQWPVTVYNVNEEALSEATDKQDYINIWNSDPDNAAIGTLSGGPGPFLFMITLKSGQSTPGFVLGVGGPGEGILTEDGDFMVTEDDEFLIQE